MEVRKYLTVIVPFVPIIGLVFFDVQIIDNNFLGLLSIALILQSISLHIIYSEQIIEYSENLADKFIPQALQSRFGPLITTLIVFLSTYVLGFFIIISSVYFGIGEHNDITTLLLCSFIVGSLLSPLVQSVFDSNNFEDVIGVNSAGIVYFMMIVFAILGSQGIEQTLDDHITIEKYIGTAKILFLIGSILFVKANYIIDRSFKQNDINHLLLFLVVPVLSLIWADNTIGLDISL